jgi:ubiquinone/menaquinone biosynthesis C-methylase UbiE
VSVFGLVRAPRPEILDGGRLPASEVEKSLDDIRRANRFLGGYRAAGAMLPALAAGGRGPVSILDFGSGLGDVPRRLAALASRRGIEVRITMADVQVAHLAASRRRLGALPPAVAADVRRTPIADGAFDWAVSTLLLHHFSPEDNVRILREMARVARRGVLAVDLARHRLALWAVGGLGPLLFRSRVSVIDGRISVAQAYTAGEIQDIASRAGLRRPTVSPVWPFRLFLRAGA